MGSLRVFRVEKSSQPAPIPMKSLEKFANWTRGAYLSNAMRSDSCSGRVRLYGETLAFE
jgi:hypothetical protein